MFLAVVGGSFLLRGTGIEVIPVITLFLVSETQSFFLFLEWHIGWMGNCLYDDLKLGKVVLEIFMVMSYIINF